ncbi:hypothetical protein Q4544_03860 [Cognatishimia sp. 1_MG-2023]|uniref:dCTP deaminase domain-containing protein n=1 Tax=Cognatishimia sp. 1_MG-2023 TaxID=3062642 RepID=UPI0026E2A27B|nr:hypothetical protein [Cognatishimia sp. 1_MG-2023]MDO6726061.1 hypothetical protein [Cognatishimia sp. 1_MG-2023]
MIIGSAILDCKLLEHADAKNLKHSTYDLTIGQIFPTGSSTDSFDQSQNNGIYILEPRQSVLVLSNEEFQLPSTITGLATLRTTFTKKGLLALNVGIIDPHFNGPISTTLINFSEQKVAIKIGMPFFRVMFFLHGDTSDYHRMSENMDRADYIDDLIVSANRDFPKSFLNLPNLDNSYYADTAWKMIKGLTVKRWFVMIPIYLVLLSTFGFLIQNTGYVEYLIETLKSFKEVVPFF